jgi:putative PIN family toxin of toxin-antitoxin system
MAQLKVVLDANVIVSAIFGGYPRKALLKALTECALYYNEGVEQELELLIDGLQHKLKSKEGKELRSIIKEVLSLAERVQTTRRLSIGRDPKDNSYLETCLEVEADVLITGDRDLLDIPREKLEEAGLANLKIVRPRQFVEDLY